MELRDLHLVDGYQLPYKNSGTYALWLTNVQSLKHRVQFLRLPGACGWARVRFSVADIGFDAKKRQRGRAPGKAKKALKKPVPDKAREKSPPSTQELQPLDAATFEQTIKSLQLNEEVDLPSALVAQEPQPLDARVFQQTTAFQPTIKTLQLNEEVNLPSALVNAIGIGHVFASANTVGDGACGMHAMFGHTNKEGKLEVPRARELAAQGLEAALRQCRRSPHAEAVRISLWNELAVPGACGAETPEARLFWAHFVEQYPAEAEEVRTTVAQAKQQEIEDRQLRFKLVNACRCFFLQGTQDSIDAVCSHIGYIGQDGEEACFEERRGHRYVKGTRDSVWPEGGPVRKMDAIRNHDPVFDALRTTVFLGRDLTACIATLEKMRVERPDCDALCAVLSEYRDCRVRFHATTQLAEPASFEEAAVDAYLLAVTEASYFFSCDEVAAVAEARAQSLVIVKEAGDASFVPCSAVESGSGPPIIILLKGAQSNLRARSHFERLAPLSAIASWSERCSVQQTCPTLHSSKTSPCSQGQLGTPTGEGETHSDADFDDTAEAGLSFSREQWLEEAQADGQAEVEELVAALLQAYERGGDVQAVLQQMPLFSKEIANADFGSMRSRLQSAVQQYVCCKITGADAVHLAMPFWRTCFLPLAVLFEAWSRTTGMPTNRFLLHSD